MKRKNYKKEKENMASIETKCYPTPLIFNREPSEGECEGKSKINITIHNSEKKREKNISLDDLRSVMHRSVITCAKPFLCSVEEFGKTLRFLNDEKKLSEEELKDACFEFHQKLKYTEVEKYIYISPNFTEKKNCILWRSEKEFTPGELLFCKLLERFLPVNIIANKIVTIPREFAISLRKGFEAKKEF